MDEDQRKTAFIGLHHGVFAVICQRDAKGSALVCLVSPSVHVVNEVGIAVGDASPQSAKTAVKEGGFILCGEGEAGGEQTVLFLPMHLCPHRQGGTARR